MNNIPSISVCIATYNQAHYLEKCVESVMTQTLLPDEIIISNDASTDNTFDVLAKLSQKHHFISIINQPVNLGLTANSNAALKAAKGDYIVRLASDDLLLPNYVFVLSTLLTEYSNAGFAHCSVSEIDAGGKHIQDRYLFRKQTFENAEEALKESLEGFKVAANILMFRKTALEKVGYLNCKQNFAEDYYISVEISANGYGNVYSNEVLACYRVWNDTNIIRQKRKLEEINGLISVFDQAILPAYKNKGWSLSKIITAKGKFAIEHANCLGWTIYTTAEKNELTNALMFMLSSSKKSRFYYLLYRSKFKKIPVYSKKIKELLKKVAKKTVKLNKKKG